MIFRAVTVWTGLPAVTTPNNPEVTLGVPKQLTRFARIGDSSTIGCVPQSASLLGS